METLGQDGINSLQFSMGIVECLQFFTEGWSARGRLNESLEEGTKIEPGSSHNHHRSSLLLRLRDFAVCERCKIHGVELLVRIPNINACMRIALEHRSAELARPNVHSSINLHRIGRYNSRVPLIGQRHRRGCFASGRWTTQEEDRAHGLHAR